MLIRVKIGFFNVHHAMKVVVIDKILQEAHGVSWNFSPAHYLHHTIVIWATTRQNQQSDCAPSEDSDKPGHLPSLIRVFAMRSMGS